VLLVRDGDPVPTDAMQGAQARVVVVPSETADVFAALVAAAAELPLEFVFLSADRVIDLRVLRALGDSSGTVVATTNGGLPEPVGRTCAADVREAGAALAARARRLDVAQLDPYVPELRGNVAAFVVPARTVAERATAWRLLLDGVQKQTLDLPGQYFDTPFENALVRRLAPTRITPNQITAATTVIAGATGLLFLHGWLRIGLVLALAVGILDGVDGKLARLKLATSRMGTLEHVTDFFYENFWYLSLATYLGAAGAGIGLWRAGLVLFTCDFVDNLLYLGVRVRTGRMLDEVSLFDRRFRAVAGRRNVYVMIFAGGFFTGHAAAAFLAASGWAVVTVAVHAARLAAIVRAPPAGDVAAPLTFQVSEIESASGALLNEK
jgi:phosphatidylglycerophosphate synthase